MLTKTSKPNFRVITEETTELRLSNGHTCIIDTEDYKDVSRWKWKARKSSGGWYAVRTYCANGHKSTISLHRYLMDTPDNEECHHKDLNTLNNCKSNLINYSKQYHQQIHAQLRITKCN